MTIRYVFGAIFLVVFLCALLVDIPTSQAIDSKARTGFESAVTGSGGSEASALPELVTNTINIMLYVAGVIAVIIIVIGGLRFATSEGDPAAANKAKNAIIYALVGLVLAILAYAIVNFVLNGIK